MKVIKGHQKFYWGFELIFLSHITNNFNWEKRSEPEDFQREVALGHARICLLMHMTLFGYIQTT